MKCFTVILILAFSALKVRAEVVDYVWLKDNCANVAALEGKLIRGRVISDCYLPNNELNTNLTERVVDTKPNGRTAYIQNEEGTQGLRLRFSNPMDNRMERYSLVTISLDGAEVIVEHDPERYTVSNLTYANVLSVEPGEASDIPVKSKYVLELTDEDVYTWVTLQDVEFAFKDGCFSNIYDPYVLASPVNSGNPKWRPNGRMDGWANLLLDSKGGAIYMMINTLCQWRRDGSNLPVGRGRVSGVVVHTPMRRLGGYMGRYSIRPMTREDICVGNRLRESSYRIVAGSEFVGIKDGGLDFHILGHVPDLRNNPIAGMKVIAEYGDAAIYAENQAKIYLHGDYTAVDAHDKGWIGNGAICFETPADGWFVWNKDRVCGAHGICMQFRPQKNAPMVFKVRICAGLQEGETAWGFPAIWQASCSTDGGRTFRIMEEIATGRDTFCMRTLPWWSTRIGRINCPTSFDAGLGYVERCFALPLDCGDAENVIIRLAPASTLIVSAHADPSADTVGYLHIARGMKNRTVIRIGEISVYSR